MTPRGEPARSACAALGAKRPALVAARAVLVGAAMAVVLAFLSIPVDAVPVEAGQPSGGSRPVLATTVDDAITPVVADHLADALGRAERGGYQALVVRLDTPGGLDTAMRRIIQDFLASPVPVIVYVSPQGARAASAGALMTFAAHVAAMAPGSAIGAATPVGLEGGDVERKVINDAAAFAESVAAARGRNVEFARDTVVSGRSVPAGEAVAIGAVDLVSATLADLLEEIDGTVVAVEGQRAVALETAGATVDDYEMSLFRRIRQILADPNLAFLLLSLGTLAIVYELASPGVGAGGAVGAVSLTVALFSLAVLPVNAVGLILLAVAAILFVAELYAPGIGVAAVGGTVALVFSGLFLFDDAPGLGVSLAVVAPTAVVVGALVVVAGRLVVRSRAKTSTTTGTGVFVGRTLHVDHVEAGSARARVDGSWWRLRSDADLVEGTEVRVVAMEGLDLVVEATPSEAVGDEEKGQS